MGQRLLGREVTTLARDTIPPLVLHGLLVSVIGISLSRFDNVKTIVVELIEVVAGIADFVGLNAFVLLVLPILKHKGDEPINARSSTMASSNSCFSFDGFVSSNLKIE